MTRERIEDMREVVLPFVKKRLLEINFENLGESDAEEFAREFNEILDLAIKAVEQEPILDLIKEEIENTYYEMPSNYNHMQRTDFFLQVIKIIDRYKAEVRVKNERNEYGRYDKNYQ